MSELTTLARPYAKAAFEFAQSNNNLSEWTDMLAFAAAVVADGDFAKYLDNPALTRKQAADVILKISEGRVDEKGQNFLRLLAENKRLELLPAIAELFEFHRAEYEKTLDVDITSAVALNESQQSKVSERLSAKLGRKVQIKVTTDESLIAGMIIHAGDMIIDSSVRGSLSDLSDALIMK